MKTTMRRVLIGNAILIFLIGLPGVMWMVRSGRLGGMVGRYPMMGHDSGFWMPFGWLGMGFMWLLPLGVLVLLILGLAGLVNTLFQRPPAPPIPPAPPRSCANCGKQAQTDWQTCPYCSQPLG